MTNSPTVEKLLYTPVEAAHALGVSRSTIYVLMAGGNLPSLRIGASRRIPARRPSPLHRPTRNWHDRQRCRRSGLYESSTAC